MPPALRQVLERTGLGRPAILGLVAVGFLAVLALFGGSRWVGEGEYVPLFAGLSPEEAGAIVAQLRATKTPFRIGATGEQILVPAARAGEVRLRLAAQGLPLGGGVGFEVFDRSGLGVSDFAQRLNFQRALQGELARTIAQLPGVARARVHLVLPQPSLFAERERPASASVFLKLHPGARVGEEQVRGIVHLVAASVERLTPDRVTVVDTAGRVLALGGEAGAGPLSARRLDLRAAVEESLERRVQALLDQALGPGQALVRVSAQLNFDQVERTEERFDPRPVPRQQVKTVESTRGATATPGAGAASPPGATGATASNEGSRQTESTTYELSRVVARTLTAPGDLRRLTVAVLLNTPTRPGPAGRPEPAARSPEELEKIRKLVMGTVGYTQARGDEVTVVELPFEAGGVERERPGEEVAPAAAAPASPTRVPRGLAAAGGAVLLGALGAGTAWFLRRRARRRALAAAETVATVAAPAADAALVAAAGAAGTSGEIEVAAGGARERDDLRQQALSLATAEPEAAARLLRVWLDRKRAPQPAGRS